MNQDSPESEVEVLRRGVAAVAERLPDRWGAKLLSEPGSRADALMEIRDAAGDRATLVVEAKRLVAGRDVASIRTQIEVSMQRLGASGGLVAARYLSAQVRSKLAEVGLSYVDATGNVRVELSRPGLFLSDRGEDRDPWRGPGRPLGTLKGEPAAKIVRALVDFGRTWRMRELAEVSKSSTGATYRVVEFLEREGLVTRDSDGRVDVDDWAGILRRWSDDYGFSRTNQVTRWIAPRGLPALRERLASGRDSTRYAVSGTIAAAEWAAHAPARVAMIYTDDVMNVAAEWGLRPTDVGANVLLAEPKYEVVLERSSQSEDGLRVAAPSQVVTDLMTGPGRNPNEAEELLEWMKTNEQSWRR
ncbi:MAG: hypothetical protein KDB26_03675 [Microthrixaceae bacterium]|nr:hypothetical protein [Microthrixaceae bacterium]